MKKTLLLLFPCLSFQFAICQYWTADASNNIHNTNTSNVGIGVSSPGAKLEIAPNAFGTFRAGITGDRAHAFSQFQNSAAAIADNNTISSFIGAVAWDFYNNGTSPSWAGTMIQHFGTGMTGTSYGVTAANQGLLVFQNCSNAVIGSNGADIYVSPLNNISTVFKTNGYVGIGTVSPRGKLDIWGGNLYVTGSDVTGTLVGGAQSGFAYLGCNSLTNSISIAPNGNVGIGNPNTSSSKLAVEGTISARKVQVMVGAFPDYVFKPEYKLPTLDSIASYIKGNGHLPDMPSAATVAKDGLDLGGNQAALLKKIEELTLYAIKQQKKITDQEKTIRQQQLNFQKLNQRITLLENTTK